MTRYSDRGLETSAKTREDERFTVLLTFPMSIFVLVAIQLESNSFAGAARAPSASSRGEKGGKRAKAANHRRNPVIESRRLTSRCAADGRLISVQTLALRFNGPATGDDSRSCPTLYAVLIQDFSSIGSRNKLRNLWLNEYRTSAPMRRT